MLGIQFDRAFAEQLLRAAADEHGDRTILCVFCDEDNCDYCYQERM